MELIEVKTAELSGVALEWAVAKADDLDVQWWSPICGVHLADTPKSRSVIAGVRDFFGYGRYTPLAWTFWREIDRLAQFAQGKFTANAEDAKAILVCRSVVASVFGEVVHVPADLVAA